MILNPHLHSEPNPNRLLGQLLALSILLHLAVFLVTPSPEQKVAKKIKTIAVVLDQTKLKASSPQQSPATKATASKRAAAKSIRDPFPKFPKKTTEPEQEAYLPQEWDEAEMPLKADFKTKKPEAVTERATQLEEPAETSEPGPIAPAKSNDKATEKESPSLANTSQIEGEAEGRELIYQPITPPMDLSQDVTITLQFEVTADGRVTNISPLLKGNSQLEQVATGLLAQYRFEAAKAGSPNQQGLIHFTITRRP